VARIPLSAFFQVSILICFFYLPIMTQVPPSPMIAFDDDEKTHYRGDGDAEGGKTAIPVVEEDSSSSGDGDDALKLAGTHAHHFDEKYYARLRWKIVGFSRTEVCKSSAF